MVKNVKRKYSVAFLIITLLLMLLQSNIYATQGYPYIHGISGILMEYSTGEILYEKDMDARVYPASTTKLLTALIAMEELDLDAVYTVPNNFPRIGGSTINVKIGETLTNRDLILASLLNSANDASTALAFAIAGSIEEFAVLMNQKAANLGCTNSSFVNPSGLHNNNHYTTAKDMVLIARAFMQNAELFAMTSMTEYTIPATNLSPARSLRNTNRFLTGDKFEGENFQIDNNGKLIPVTYEIVDGLKTGTTPQAKNCLVSTAKVDNLRVISVVFGSTESGVYSDSRHMIDYGLDNYTYKEIITSGAVVKTIKNFTAVPDSVDLVVREGYSYVEPNTFGTNIKGEAKIDKINLPLSQGQQVGIFTIKNFDTNTVIKEIPIYASSDFESRISWSYLGKSSFGRIFRVVFLVVILLLILTAFVFGIREYNRHKNIEQTKQLRKKQRN